MRIIISLLFGLSISSLHAQVDIEYDTSIVLDIDPVYLRCGDVDSVFADAGLDVKKIYRQENCRDDLLKLPSSAIAIPKKSHHPAIIANSGRREVLTIYQDTCLFVRSKKKRIKVDYHFEPGGEFVDDTTGVYIATSGDSRCSDTGYNNVIIYLGGKKVEFKCLLNVSIISRDLNKDGAKEVYLFSFGWCDSELTVYRISELQ